MAIPLKMALAMGVPAADPPPLLQVTNGRAVASYQRMSMGRGIRLVANLTAHFTMWFELGLPVAYTLHCGNRTTTRSRATARASDHPGDH